MHAVVRTYVSPDSQAMVDLLIARKAELESLMRAVPGFVSYTAIQTETGGIAVTVCQDKAGTDRSSEVARDFIGQHAQHLNVDPPSVTEGEAFLLFT